MMEQKELGRRERKKRATKQALERAALELFIERGYDQVNVADIAAGVDVDPSTFFRHFGSKEAVLYEDAMRAPAIIESVLHERPPDEPLEETVRAILEVLVDSVVINSHRAALQLKLMSQSEDLSAYHFLYNERIRDRLAEGIADRVGVQRRHDPRPDILAAVFIAALEEVRRDIVNSQRTPTSRTVVSKVQRLLEPITAYCRDLDAKR
ncbi:TetR/AcrR family transcriptional regulator [Mycobacterium sp. Marseille-P9652]|uniref:TetR/AcrR family transcriptional regulator n=1 Tax=Mycobacterium sp. Marseille-P9652 TaxID=2654950 RepID=UPI0018D0C956|nr:TetR/AcrR family transcriptional regulator [Mycobacterium sp. Marseille-P9652]